jgi:hypothetical protein
MDMLDNDHTPTKKMNGEWDFNQYRTSRNALEKLDCMAMKEDLQVDE